MLLYDEVAIGRAQLHFLRLGCLLAGGNAGIANLPALWSTGRLIFGANGHLLRLSVSCQSWFQCGAWKINILAKVMVTAIGS